MPRQSAVSSKEFASISLAAVFLLAAVVGCSPGTATLQREFLVFGSSAELNLRGAPSALANAADAVERVLAEYDRDWHPWRESALVELNRAIAAGKPHRTIDSIRMLIEASRPLVRSSAGLFDPAAGGLVRAWGFHSSEWPTTAAPDAHAIAAWRAAPPRFEDLRVDGLQVTASNRLLQLDFNAIAEGVAAGRVVRILREHGIDHALFDLGGDVIALGDAGGRPWRVALRDPRGDALGWVELADGEALFASGSYAKYREDAGRRRPHVLDPRSGEPVVGSAASAVLAIDPVLADAAATALMVGGAADFDTLLAAMQLRCALLLTDDDVLHISSALAQRLTLLRQPARVRVVAGPPRCSAPNVD
jgi:thiamine biosynthesis lipoprotein